MIEVGNKKSWLLYAAALGWAFSAAAWGQKQGETASPEDSEREGFYLAPPSETTTYPDYEWVWGPGGLGNDETRGVAAYFDGLDEYVFLTGLFEDQATFGSAQLTGNGDTVFVAKYFVDGTQSWATASSLSYIPLDIAIDSVGNAILVGFAGDFPTQDVLIEKLDVDGKRLWSFQNVDSGRDRARGVATDSQNNIYVTGYFQGNLTIGAATLVTRGSEDIFLAKFSSTGALLWLEQIGGSGSSEEGAHVWVSETDEVYLVGFLDGAGTFGNPNMPNPRVLSAGGFIAKYTADGDLAWAHKCGAIPKRIASSQKTAINENILVVGEFDATHLSFQGQNQTIHFTSGADTFLAEYDPDGNLISAEDMNTGVDVLDVESDEYGNIYLGSSVKEELVRKYDANRALAWTEGATGEAFVYGAGLAIGMDNTLFLAGRFNHAAGGASFGDILVHAVHGGFDPFLAKLQGGPSATPFVNADFTADAVVGAAPLTVVFSDNSTASNTAITSWLWDFDGDSIADANGANPGPVTYPTPGDYTVSLTVSNSDGSATDTATKINYIRVTQAANPNIAATPTLHNFGQTAVNTYSYPRSFTVQNSGGGQLLLGALALSGDVDQFELRNDGCSGAALNGLAVCSFEILFKPTTLGFKSAVLGIPSNDPDTPDLQISLSGEGVLAVGSGGGLWTQGAGDNIYRDLGNVGVGVSAPETKLHVEGASGLRVSDVSAGALAYLDIKPNVDVSALNPGGTTVAAQITNRRAGHLVLDILANDPADAFAVRTDSNHNLAVDTLAMVIRADGRVGLGTSAPNHPLELASGAHVTAGGVWTNASSRALKTDIADLESDEAMAALAALTPKRYVYKAEAGEEYLGFIAEDVPDLVASGDRKSLSAMDLVAVLTKAAQTQQAELDLLRAELAALKRRLDQNETK